MSCDGVVCCLGCLSLFPGVKKSIVNEIAFFPPKPPGYFLSEEDSRIWLLGPSGELEAIQNMPNGVTLTAQRLRTSHNSDIWAFWFRHPSAQWSFIFSHGNSTDIGHMFPHLLAICLRLKVNILAYEYTGYGMSTGSCSEANIYRDIDAAFHFLTDHEKIPPKTIILYGQSVGSAPAIDLASKNHVGGVVIHSGLKSGLSVIHEVKSTLWFDAFPNMKKIKKVTAPCFFIHGIQDQEVCFDHGLELYEAAPVKVEPWWVNDAGHNDIEFDYQNTYFLRLCSFLKLLEEKHPLDDYSQNKLNSQRVIEPAPLLPTKTQSCSLASTGSPPISPCPQVPKMLYYNLQIPPPNNAMNIPHYTQNTQNATLPSTMPNIPPTANHTLVKGQQNGKATIGKRLGPLNKKKSK